MLPNLGGEFSAITEHLLLLAAGGVNGAAYLRARSLRTL
jgi:hypothetical protein